MNPLAILMLKMLSHNKTLLILTRNLGVLDNNSINRLQCDLIQQP